MEAPEVFDKQPPPVRFSLSTAFFVLAVLCVLLTEYQAAGVQAVGAWWFTLLLAVAGFLYRSRRWAAGNLVMGAFVASGLFSLVMTPTCVYPVSLAQEHGCRDNLKALALATQEYEWRNKTLPPQHQTVRSERIGLSWRVSLLPYLNHSDTYQQFHLQQGWDSPANQQLASVLIREYRCPSELNNRGTETSYVAIAGDDTCWPTSRPIKSSNIKDGTSNTILFTETHDSGILWPEPRDLEYDKLDWRIHGTPGNSISSSHGPVIRYFDGSRKLKSRTGVNVAMADGSVRRLTPDVDPEVLRQMANRRDGLPKPEDMPD